MSHHLPRLPYADWKDSLTTIHLILQIIGKIRLGLSPRKNHWWYIVQYVSKDGFTTSEIPYDDGFHTFVIIFDVHSKSVRIETSKNEKESIDLSGSPTVAVVYKELMAALDRLGIEVHLLARPFDMGIDTPFAEITEYHHYDWEAIKKFWSIYLWVDGVMKEFSGRYYGKTCPVQIYWHHLDLAVTRFSGRKAPPMPAEARISDKDAYSHEVISFGFWAGDPNVPEPSFYSYTYPSPEGIEKIALKPSHANWVDSNGSPMALMSYHALIDGDNPRRDLLDFLETAYRAGATMAEWDVADLETPDLSEL